MHRPLRIPPQEMFPLLNGRIQRGKKQAEGISPHSLPVGLGWARQQAWAAVEWGRPGQLETGTRRSATSSTWAEFSEFCQVIARFDLHPWNQNHFR